MKIKIFLFVITMFCFSLFAQSKKNLEVIFELVDESMTEFKEINDRNIVLKFYAADNLEIIKSRVVYNLKKTEKKETGIKLNYIVDSVGVSYPEMFRDGLFGDFFLIRNIYYKGYFSVEKDNRQKLKRDFDFAKKDTIALNDVSSVETRILDFTKAEVPPEPFFESMVETVAAVGAAVLSVILFFTIRSE